MAGKKKRRAVFLDRDGTIIEDVPYLFEPEKVKLIKGAGEAIKILNRLAFRVVVVTNQSGVRRGYFKEADVKAVHSRLDSILDYEGARIDDYYFCPHEPDDGCGCRKPETQMIDTAAAENSLDVENSYVIGDKSSDLWLANNVGATSILVRTGLGLDTEKEQSIKPGFVARDILQAVEWIMIDSKTRY
ncbi:MAG: HAD family hydrolase [Thermodesulfobacteriota bacterium]